MEEITTIGLDLAKSVFQIHAIAEDGRVLARRALRRSQLLDFFRGIEPCMVGLEACASAHHWANAISQFGHSVRLMPPAYVKAYVKRNKTDAADAEAICEAVTRPTMRFVPIKTPDEQAAGMMLKLASCSFASEPKPRMPCALIWPSSASSPQPAWPVSSNSSRSYAMVKTPVFHPLLALSFWRWPSRSRS